MSGLEAIFLVVGLAMFVCPLALLSVGATAMYFGLRVPAWLLDATALALALQGHPWGWVNLAGGLTLAGAGIWITVHDGSPAHRVAALIFLVAAGSLRAWRGGSIIRNAAGHHKCHSPVFPNSLW